MSSEPPSNNPIVVRFTDQQTVGVDTRRICAVAERAALGEGARGEVSITLVNPERMAALNAAHMHKQGPTDVLSFPVDGLVGPGEPDDPPVLIGEVVLCPEVAALQAEAGLEAELDLLVAHGVLHLLGYDHETPEGAEQMRRRELALTGRAGARA